jgi:4-hydroxythreonine-4-phosphate dehydrogenase
MYRLSITCGDVNGIGPEISIKTINKIFKPGREQIILFCPANIFESTSSIVKPAFNFQIVKELKPSNTFREKVIVVDIGKVKQRFGDPSAESGATAFKAILSAFNSVKDNFSDAIITAPLSKTSFKMAGIDYPGQTEIMADLCNSKNYMMVFLSSKMVCGLLTIHESIKNVPKLITARRLEKAIGILEKTLIQDLGIKSPKIAVLGLNPHAGEKGKIGTEELKTIEPFIDSLEKDKNVYGPFVPDAFFATKSFYNFAAVLGMYHDQLLIPFKMMNFNRGVNYTAGLPVIRTSPDHGTAFDIAGKGIADESSMVEAARWAKKIIRNRKNKC